MSQSYCKHCLMDIALRNPSGFCDHLYYPENCGVCRRANPTEVMKLQDKIAILEKELQELKAENEKLKKSTLYQSLCGAIIARILEANADCEPEHDILLRLETIIRQRDSLQAQNLSLVAALKKIAEDKETAPFGIHTKIAKDVLALSPQDSREALKEIVGTLKLAKEDLEIIKSYLPECLPEGMTAGKQIRLKSIVENLVKIDAALTTAKKVFGVKGDLR